jgi:hypothetical protein
MHTIYDLKSSKNRCLSINPNTASCSVTSRDLRKARRSASRGIIRKPRVVKDHTLASCQFSRCLELTQDDTFYVRRLPWVDIPGAPLDICYGQVQHVPHRNSWSLHREDGTVLAPNRDPVHVNEKFPYSFESKSPKKESASKSHSGSRSDKQSLLGSAAPGATSQTIQSTLYMRDSQIAPNSARIGHIYQRFLPVNITPGLALAQQFHVSRFLHPPSFPVPAVPLAETESAYPTPSYPTSSSPANDAGDILQLLLRVCAGTTSTIADPRLGHRAPRFSESDSDYPSPVYQDPHSLLLRLIHADAAAAALRQANAQVRFGWP